MNAFFKSIPNAPQGLPVTDMIRVNAQFPGAAILGDDLYVHYQNYCKGHDSLQAGILGEKGLEKVMTLSGEGEVLYPVALSFGGNVCYAWSETRGKGWALCIRWIRNGQAGEIITVEENEAVFYPNLFTHKGQLYLTYTRQKHNAADAVLCTVDGDAVGAWEKHNADLRRRCNRSQGIDGALQHNVSDGTHRVFQSQRQSDHADLLHMPRPHSRQNLAFFILPADHIHLFPEPPYAQSHTDPLTDDRCHCRAGHPHGNHQNKNQIQHHIDAAGDHQEPERPLGITKSPEHTGEVIIQHRGDLAHQNDG